MVAALSTTASPLIVLKLSSVKVTVLVLDASVSNELWKLNGVAVVKLGSGILIVACSTLSTTKLTDLNPSSFNVNSLNGACVTDVYLRNSITGLLLASRV